MKSVTILLILLLETFGRASMENSVDFSSLTHVLSKIQHLTLVSASPHSHLDEIPHLCWRATQSGMEPFQSLPQTLAQFSGRTDWYLIGDLPRICLFPQPKSIVELRGQQLTQFVMDVRDDIPKLANFIDQELRLEEQASLGFEVEPSTLELPLIADSFEPNVIANVSLVRDPTRFLQHWGPTSDFDTSLHCGIATGEYAVLKSEYHKTYTANDKSSLASFFSAILAQRSAVVQPGEVEELERQLNSWSTEGNVNWEPIQKLLSICRSARSYDLGIVIQFQ